jgi:hypothetical protein
LAVLTEAREAGRGAVAVIVTDVAVVIPTVMTSTPAATFTVEEDVLALVRARPVTDTIVPRDEVDVTMTDALAVIATAVAVLVAGAPASPLNSMKMNGINELFLCSSLPHV